MAVSRMGIKSEPLSISQRSKIINRLDGVLISLAPKSLKD